MAYGEDYGVNFECNCEQCRSQIAQEKAQKKAMKKKKCVDLSNNIVLTTSRTIWRSSISFMRNQKVGE